MPLLVSVARRFNLGPAAPILAAIPAQTVLILGDNPGAEQRLILALFSQNPDLVQRVYHADWQHHHSAARAIRDQHLLAEAEAVLVFTTGTDHYNSPDGYINDLIAAAHNLCLPITVYDRDCNLIPPQPSIYDYADSTIDTARQLSTI